MADNLNTHQPGVPRGTNQRNRQHPEFSPEKRQPDRDVAMTYEVVEEGYRHLFGSYLALARHFKEHGPQEDADRYNGLFSKYHREELELYRLTDAELWTHKTEVLPPLIAQVHALRKQHLGY